MYVSLGNAMEAEWKIEGKPSLAERSGGEPEPSSADFGWFACLEGWKDGGMEGWKDGGMEGWRDGRMEGWRDGRRERKGPSARRVWVEGWGVCVCELEFPLTGLLRL